MCSRPSRSLNNTVTALIRFSSVRYLSRSSWILWIATRFRRCSFACRFSSSSSSYESARKLRSSLDMDILQSPNRVGRINVANNVTDAQAVAAAGIQLGSITRERGCPQIEKADGSDKRDLFQFLVMDQCQICWVETTAKTTLTDADQFEFPALCLSRMARA